MNSVCCLVFLKQQNGCECVYVCIHWLNLMWDTQLVYEITNAVFIQLYIRLLLLLLMNMYSGD